MQTIHRCVAALRQNGNDPSTLVQYQSEAERVYDRNEWKVQVGHVGPQRWLGKSKKSLPCKTTNERSEVLADE